MSEEKWRGSSDTDWMFGAQTLLDDGTSDATVGAVGSEAPSNEAQRGDSAAPQSPWLRKPVLGVLMGVMFLVSFIGGIWGMQSLLPSLADGGSGDKASQEIAMSAAKYVMPQAIDYQLDASKATTSQDPLDSWMRTHEDNVQMTVERTDFDTNTLVITAKVYESSEYDPDKDERVFSGDVLAEVQYEQKLWEW